MHSTTKSLIHVGHAHLHTIAPYHCGCYVPKPSIKYCSLLVSTHWNWPPRPGWKKWTSQSISRSSVRQLISQDAWILLWNTSHWFSWIHRDLSVIYETLFHGQRDNVNSPILGWHSAEIQSPRHVGIGILRSLKYSLNCFSAMFSHQNGRQMHIHPTLIFQQISYWFHMPSSNFRRLWKITATVEIMFHHGPFSGATLIYIYILYIYIYVTYPQS